jgi:hypothetical protein
MRAFIFATATLQTAGTSVWPPSGHVAPVLLFGPTANHPDTIANETLALITEEGVDSWPEVRGRLQSSGGALHVRNQVINGFMTEAERALFGSRSAELGLQISLEAGGSLCGTGSGAASAATVVKKLKPFLDAGGKLAYYGLESVFSRTHRGCPSQSLNNTVLELAEYAAVSAAGLPDTKFFLYDALPHFKVGGFPANDPQYDMDLMDVLTKLRDAMADRGVKLEGYWMDCPYEYSRDLPGDVGDGFKKIATALKLIKSAGMKAGKTLNSQEGGSTSDKKFHDGTLLDFENTTAVVPSQLTGGYSFDFLMVESWYTYPATILPESKAYTMAYTAHEVFGNVREGDVIV